MVQSFGRHIEIKNYRLKAPCAQNLCTLGALCGEKKNLCGEKYKNLCVLCALCGKKNNLCGEKYKNLCVLCALCGEKNNLCGEKFAWEEVYQKKINFEVVKGCSVDEHICRIQDITGNKSNNLDNNFV